MFTELLRQVGRTVNGLQSIQDLEDWLVANLQDLLDSDDKRIVDLASCIDADLVEWQEGIVEEKTLRDRLSSCLSQAETICISLPKPQQCITTGNSSSNATMAPIAIGGVVDTVREAAVFA